MARSMFLALEGVVSTILIDVDDVICDNHFLPVVNNYLNSNYKEDDFKSEKYELELFPKAEDRFKFYDYFCSVDSYENLGLKKGVSQVLERLCQKHRVILLTNACHFENSFAMGRQFFDKWKFLLKELPFFPPENIIFSAQKDLLVADMIIDDRISNLRGGDYKYRLLFSCFHNKNISDEELEKNGIIRMDSWHEIEKFINKFLK